MAEHGGAREGAGRKPKERLFKDLSLVKRRKLVMSFVNEDDLKEIVINMIKRAKGDDGDAKYIINQFIGKPLQATDITSGGDKIESFNDEQVKRIAKRIASGRSGNGGSSSS